MFNDYNLVMIIRIMESHLKLHHLYYHKFNIVFIRKEINFIYIINNV